MTAASHAAEALSHQWAMKWALPTPALRELAEALKRGESVSIAVDGPAGPAFKVKRGCVDLALETGAPVVPVAFYGSRRLEAPRWDRALLPTPLERIVVRYGAPIDVAGLSHDDALARVEASMLALAQAPETAGQG